MLAPPIEVQCQELRDGRIREKVHRSNYMKAVKKTTLTFNPVLMKAILIVIAEPSCE